MPLGFLTRKICSISLVILMSCGVVSAGEVDQAKESLKKAFPKLLNIHSVESTPVKGIFEVIAGNTIFYYSPDSRIVLFGEMWRDGESLTNESRSKLDKIQADAIGKK